MCTVVYLEPEDFARELVHNQKNVYARTYVLDCGLAVIIYMCQDSHFLYYLDRPDCSKEKKDMLKSMDFYELHAEIYRKVNLDNRLRERQNKPKLDCLGLFNISKGKVFACLFIITIAKTCIELFFCIIYTWMNVLCRNP